MKSIKYFLLWWLKIYLIDNLLCLNLGVFIWRTQFIELFQCLVMSFVWYDQIQYDIFSFIIFKLWLTIIIVKNDIYFKFLNNKKCIKFMFFECLEWCLKKSSNSKISKKHLRRITKTKAKNDGGSVRYTHIGLKRGSIWMETDKCYISYGKM